MRSISNLFTLLTIMLCVQLSHAQGPTSFARIGSEGNDFNEAVVKDCDGNIYFAGSFTGGTLSTPVGPLINNYGSQTNGTKEIFVVKADPSGNVLWAKSAGGPGDDRIKSIWVDKSGTLWVGGHVQDTAMFDSITIISRGPQDGFVAKISPTGKWLRADGFGASGSSTSIEHIVLDAQGSAYLAGRFQDSLLMGGVPIVRNGFNAFLANINFLDDSIAPLGKWAQPVGNGEVFETDPNRDAIGDLDISADGLQLFFSTVFINPVYYGSDSFPPPNFATHPTWHNIFLGALNTNNGNLNWHAVMDEEPEGFTPSPLVGIGLACDSFGVYMTGTFRGQLNFPSGFLRTNTGEGSDAYLGKWALNGNFTWCRQFGGSLDEHGQAVDVRHDGKIVIGGLYNWFVDFGTGQLPQGATSLYLAQINPSGLTCCAYGFPNSRTGCTGLRATTLDDTWVIGQYNQQSDFGITTPAVSGGLDAYLMNFRHSIVSVPEIWKPEPLPLFPVPARDAVWIRPHLKPGELKNAVLKIYDTRGRTVHVASLKGQVHEIEVRTLENGIYVAVLRAGDRRFSGRIVVQH